MKAPRLLLTVCVLATLAPGQLSANPLAEKLPEATVFYFGWAGRSLTFDGSLLGELVREPKVAEIFGGIHKAISAGIGDDEKGQAALESAWGMAGIAWQKPAAMRLLSCGQTVPMW